MELKPFDGTLDDASAELKPFSGQLDPPTQVAPAPPAIARPSSTIRRVVGDTAVDLGKGLLGVGEAVVGAANLVSGGYAGKGMEAIGYDPATSKKMLEEGYTPERVAANKEVADAKGFMPTIAAAIKNPSTIAGAVVESAPLMLGGGAVSQGLKRVIASPIVRGAIGEGLVGAGASAEQTRQQSDTGLLDAKGTVSAIGAGAGTAVLGALGGKVAQKLGIADVDTALAGGSTLAGPKKNILRRAAHGVLAEGVFEELPQSAQEQMWSNYATGKPIMDGVAEASAMGALAGGVMGGGFSAISRPGATPATQDAGSSPQPAPAPTQSAEQPSQPSTSPAAGTSPLAGGESGTPLSPQTELSPSANPTPDPFDGEVMNAELDAAMAPPSTTNLSEPATNRVQQAAANMRMEAQVMDAQAQTGIGKVAAMATAMQADAIEQEAPLDRLARVSAAAGFDPAEVLKANQAYDPDGETFADLPDEVLSGYAKTLLEDAARGPRQDTAGPVSERPDVAPVGSTGNDPVLASGGQDQAAIGAGEVAGVPAEVAGRADAGANDAAGAQAQGVTATLAPATDTAPALPQASPTSQAQIPQAPAPEDHGQPLQEAGQAREPQLDAAASSTSLPAAGQAPQAASPVSVADQSQAASLPAIAQEAGGQDRQGEQAGLGSPAPDAGTPQAETQTSLGPSPQGTPVEGGGQPSAAVDPDSPQGRAAARDAGVPASLIAARDAATDRSQAASAAMQAFPAGPMGLTPDAVKATPEWKAARIEMDRAATALRTANSEVTKAIKTVKAKPAPTVKPRSQMTSKELKAQEAGKVDYTSMQVNAGAAFDASRDPLGSALSEYGYSLKDGKFVTPSGKETSVSVTVSKGRARVVRPDGSKLWMGTPANIGKFLEAFWMAKKPTPSAAKEKGRVEYPSQPTRKPALDKFMRDVVDYMNGDIDRAQLGELARKAVKAGLARGEITGATQRLGDWLEGDTNDVMADKPLRERAAVPESTQADVDSAIAAIKAARAKERAAAESTVPAPPVEAAQQDVATATVKESLPVANTLALQDALYDKLRAGTATLEEYKAGWQALQDNREAILADLAGMKKDALVKIAGMRARSETKPQLVKSAFGELESNYSIGRGISWSMGTSLTAAYAAQVDRTTDADLKAFADKVADARKARDQRISGAKDPQTLTEFEDAARLAGGETKLTADQRATFDRLRADARREQRDAEAKRNAVVRQVDTGGTGMDLVETTHTQKGHALFVVKMAERVEAETYKALNAAAKRLGGYYSSFRGNGAIPGFTFTSREQAEQFMAVRDGNVDASGQQQARAEAKAESRAESLAEKAEKLKAKAEESLGRERKANTAKRAGQAASAEAEARQQLALANTMAKLAEAIEAGRARMLGFVRHKSQVEMFDRAVKAAHWDYLRSQGVQWEKAKEMPLSAESLTDAKLPAFHFTRGDAAVAARRLIATRGGKAFGESLAKLVDYGDEYGEAVRANPYKFVVQKSKADGTDTSFAFFDTKKAAEGALSRSADKLRGAVVKIPAMKGKAAQWAVALHPDLAIERKLWAPDFDKKVNLNITSARKIVELLKVSDRGDQQVPYWWTDHLAKRDALAKLGIETNFEYREALREYLDLRQAPSGEDKIRKLERALVGNKAVGVDFFPTPPAVIQRLLEQADIQPGMHVLEPSAGKGDIAEAARDAAENVTVDAVEMSGTLREILEAKGFEVVANDFLAHTSEPVYDRIVMNPPFNNDNGAAHVQHAYSMLKPGGRLVAVMGNGQRGAAAFDAWLEKVGGLSETLPEGSFKSSFRPTGVSTKIVEIDRGDGPLESVESETLADTDATPAELASLKRQSQYGFRGSDGVGMTDAEKSAIQVLDREESRANGIEDSDKLGLRVAVNRAIGGDFGMPPITAVYLRGVAGLDGIVKPGYLQRLKDQQTRRGGKTRTAGLYLSEKDTVDGRPRFVLFTDTIRTPKMAAFTAAHEVAGHHGLRVLLGKRLNPVLEQAGRNPTVKAIADSMTKQRNLTPSQRLLAIEEALADLAAANATGNWQRIQDKHGVTPSKEMQSKLRAFIANVVRQIKMLFKTRNVGFSDAQVQQLLGNAFKAAQGPESAIGQPQSALESTEGGSLEGMSRTDAIAEAKRLDLPATGATDKIANLVRIATADPATWSREDFDAILPHLSVHQDVRDGSADRVATVMARGLDKGMVDPAEGLEPGSKSWSWAKGYSGGDVYAFIAGGLKFASKDNPRLAPGNKPLFHAKPDKGGSLFDAISPQPLESTEDQTQSEAFKRWFKDSKIVKPDGSPMVVYHGGAGGVRVFEPERAGSVKTADWGNGVYFTPAKWQAQSYMEDSNKAADGNSNALWNKMEETAARHGTGVMYASMDLSSKKITQAQYDEIKAIESDWRKAREDAEKNGSGEVYAAYLRIENPLIQQYDGITDPYLREYAEAKGHDGIIIVHDDGSFDEIVAFRPEQIKSADKNNGNFNPDNPSILESVEAFTLSDNPTKDDFRIPGEITLDPLHKAGVKGILSRLSKKFTDLKPAALALVPLQEMDDFTPKTVQKDGTTVSAQPAVATYIQLQNDMQAMRNTLYVDYDKTAQDLHAYSTVGAGIKGFFGKAVNQQGRDLFALMHDSTIAGVDPSEQNVRYKDPGKAAKYRDLQERYAKIPKEGQDLFKAVRDAYAAQTDLLDEVIEANATRAAEITTNRARRKLEDREREIREDGNLNPLEKAKASAAAKKAYDDTVDEGGTASKIAALRKMLESNRVPKPYFPLKRYGKYWVSVLKDGKLAGFSKFETAAEQSAFSKSMVAQGYSTRLKYEGDAAQTREMIDPKFVADVEEILTGLPDQIRDDVWQAYLERMPDMSLRKSFIHRQNVAGYHFDALKAFGSTLFHGSHQIARLKYGMEMAEAIDVAKEQANALREKDPEGALAADMVAGELDKRHAFIMNPTNAKWAQQVSGAAFLYSLGANPAHLFLNATQTVMLGVPILGTRYGFGRASKALTKAARDFAKGKGHLEKANLTTDELRAFRELQASGIIEKSQAHDIAGIGSEGVEYDSVRKKVMDKIGWFMHQSERFNREVTAMAAYRLSRQDGRGHEAALSEASKQVYQIHFDYSNAARARIMQGDMAKALLVFRNYSANMIYRLFRDIHQSIRGESPQVKREARKQLGAIMGMYGLFAGTMGVPFYGLAMALAGAFDDEDDPVTAEQQFVNGTVEFLGPTAAKVLLRGIPGTLFDVDLTERIGMGNLWFRSPNQEMEGRDAYYYWMEQLLGAGLAPVKGVFDGINLAMQGQIQRGVERASPAALRNPMQAIRMAQEGGVTSLDGDLIKEVNGGDMLTKALGFQPLSVSEQYEANNEIKGADRRLSNRRQRLLNRYFLAIQMGDDTAEPLADIQAFNLKNPEYAITRDTMQRSAKTRARNSANSEGGIVMTRRMRRLQDRLNTEETE